MASIGHVAVGLLVGRAHGAPTSSGRARAAIAFTGLALLPDLDVLGVALGLPDHTAVGHRGFSHSLIFAVTVAVVAGVLGRRFGARAVPTALLAFLAVASHGVLDAMTFTTRGVPFLWPFTEQTFMLPWQPLPEAPTDMGFLGWRGLRVVAIELVYFAPMFVAAIIPMRQRLTVSLGLGRPWARVAAALVLVAMSLTMAQTYLQRTALVGWLETLGSERLVMAPVSRSSTAQRQATP